MEDINSEAVSDCKSSYTKFSYYTEVTATDQEDNTGAGVDTSMTSSIPTVTAHHQQNQQRVLIAPPQQLHQGLPSDTTMENNHPITEMTTMMMRLLQLQQTTMTMITMLPCHKL
jgi:hypothetical protein